jgi:two-component system, NtrC family, nitrogen regulation response regulator GlnG
VKVLVVDDEPSICWGFQQLLGAEGYQVLTAGTAEAGLKIAGQNDLELVLLDVRLPGMSGLEALAKMRHLTDEAPIVVMTAFGDLETAVKAVQQGATDYLNKPFSLNDALRVCQRALRRQRLEEPPTPEVGVFPNGSVAGPQANQLIGQSASMQRVFREIALVADSDLSVLITGETGTGKELVAEAIHRHSRRRDKPYVAVAPVTFNASLLESELFGHVRGAFTGATEDRVGLFEAAKGGTILLDEIGDLPMSSQVKLLRVLEQRSYSRVGEIQSRSCDVRILAATNCDLKQAVVAGTFREDLLYRLSGINLELPALRERLEDIQPLMIHFLQLLGYPNPQSAIGENLLANLKSRAWPGNIRELRNAVELAAVVARGRKLDISDFDVGFGAAIKSGDESAWATDAQQAVQAWVRQQFLPPTSSISPTGVQLPLYERFISVVEPALLKEVLASVGGNRTAAADLLGWHRSTLRDRLKRYGIDPSE